MKNRVIILMIMSVLILTGCGGKDSKQVDTKKEESATEKGEKEEKRKKEESPKETDSQLIQRKGHPRYGDSINDVEKCWPECFSDYDDSRVIDDVSDYDSGTVLVFSGYETIDDIEIYFCNCEDISSTSWDKAKEIAKEYLPTSFQEYQFETSYKVVSDEADEDTSTYVSKYKKEGMQSTLFVVFDEDSDGSIESIQVRLGIAPPIEYPEDHHNRREEWLWNAKQ